MLLILIFTLKKKKKKNKYQLIKYIICLPNYHVWQFYQMFSHNVIQITILLISNNHFPITCHSALKSKLCILDCVVVFFFFFFLLAIVILHFRISISVSIAITYVIPVWHSKLTQGKETINGLIKSKYTQTSEERERKMVPRKQRIIATLKREVRQKTVSVAIGTCLSRLG